MQEIEKATGRPTLFVFTSDHGESLGARGEPTHGIFVYNDTLHVPLIIADSKGTNAGTVIEEPVSLVDVMPTVLERLGLELPYEIDGKPLPQKQGESSREELEANAYFESVLPYNIYGWSPLEGIVNADRKLIVAPTPELYDLKEDAGETRNRYRSDDPVAEDLSDCFAELRESKLDHPDLTAMETSLESDEIRKLMALGYVAVGDTTLVSDEELADPKDVIHLHRQLLRSRSLIVNDRGQQAFKELKSIIEEDPGNKHSYETIVGWVFEGARGLPAKDAIPLDASLAGKTTKRQNRSRSGNALRKDR